MRNLLLLSNSTNHGQGYLDHALPEIRALLDGAKRLVFVPFALHERAAYAAKARARFAAAEIEVDELAASAAGGRMLASAKAVFVGGGNTFRLLKTLQDEGLLELLRSRVRDGLPYLGASAGINIVCPTIKTTNDMPIVQPATFEALGIVPFQINPHYLDPDPGSRHMGETREDRIREFHEENEVPVLGLREGAWLRIQGADGQVGGAAAARVFRRGRAPEELAVGASLAPLLSGG
jgi:dipeptidase E